MPTYDIVCKKCKHLQEIRCSHKDLPKLRCEICREEVEVKIGATNFALRGTGWANDGYGTKR